MANEHDPMPRKLPDEPHFALMGRDPFGAEVTRLWIALKARDMQLFDAVAKRVKAQALALPRQPHKDAEHILSAKGVATQMDVFFHTLNAPGRADRDVDATTPFPEEVALCDVVPDPIPKSFSGRIGEEARLTEIKHAHPPREPEDAQ